jgi:hypothetical protein
VYDQDWVLLDSLGRELWFIDVDLVDICNKVEVVGMRKTGLVNS